jgi:hypothetical protein
MFHNWLSGEKKMRERERERERAPRFIVFADCCSGSTLDMSDFQSAPNHDVMGL